MASLGEEKEVRRVLPQVDFTALDQALAKEGDDALQAAVLTYRPADLARELSRRKYELALRVFQACPDRRAAALLRAAWPQTSARLLAECEPERAVKILDFLHTEDEIAILEAMPQEERQRIVEALAPEDAKLFEQLRAYPEAAVGRFMTPRVWRVSQASTVAEALNLLREQAGEIEVAANCYVVDESGLLLGVSAMREMVLFEPHTDMASVMTKNPVTVRADAPRSDAADIIQTYDFLSLPVVDERGALLGAVRVDDLLDAALVKLGTDLLNQGAVAVDSAKQMPYFQTPISGVVKSRITWLVLLFVAETATGTVLRHFEEQLAQVVALAFFIPLLIGTGGNAGSQTVATIIRALALGEVKTTDVWRVMGKELTAGLFLGLLLGGIAFGRALMWGVGSELAACVAFTILIVCCWANLVGAAVPILAERLNIDPTVISGPFITTLVDASGLFIYLSVAKMMLSQLA